MSGIDIEGTLSARWPAFPGEAFTASDGHTSVRMVSVEDVAAVLREQIEGALAETKRDALANEAEWLHGAHANSHDKGYSAEYRKGFLAAAGWVRFHARMDHLSDTERAGGAG